MAPVALKARGRKALKKIADPSIRAHYGEDIKRLRLDLFGQNAQPFRPYTPRGQGRAGGRFPFQPVAPMPRKMPNPRAIDSGT